HEGVEKLAHRIGRQHERFAIEGPVECSQLILHPCGPDVAIDESAVSCDRVLEKAILLCNQLPEVHCGEDEILEGGERVVHQRSSLDHTADVGLVPAALLNLRLDLN